MEATEATANHELKKVSLKFDETRPQYFITNQVKL